MYIGIDLGGTNIAAGLVNKKCEVISKMSIPTLSSRPGEEIVKDMAMLCEKLIKENNLKISDIEKIGIGCPGSIDSKNGIVLVSNNLHWDNFEIIKEFKKYFKDTPLAIENDANAAAYGEYIVNESDKSHFVAITLGTGIGGGVVIDKKIYRGFNGVGGELGHIVLVKDGCICSCGMKGCWESYASVTALIRQTKEAIKAHPESLMAQDTEINGRTSFDAAKKGDKAAQEVVDNYLEYVAAGLVSIINIFTPEVLVIGGGISKEGDYLLDPVKDYVAKNVFCKLGPQTEIKIAKLRNDAGIVGAALA